MCKRIYNVEYDQYKIIKLSYPNENYFCDSSRIRTPNLWSDANKEQLSTPNWITQFFYSQDNVVAEAMHLVPKL